MLIARIYIYCIFSWFIGRRELGSGLKMGIFNRCFNDVLSKLTAFTALACYAQFLADIFK